MKKLLSALAGVPVLGWLMGALAAVTLERVAGKTLAAALGLPKMPVLFGLQDMVRTPSQAPFTLGYEMLVHILPVLLAALLGKALWNALARGLMRSSLTASTLLHLGLLYAILHIWTGVNEYQLITVKFTLIAVLVTLSLNITNGYLGEFACSHPGFMALGAYITSIVSMSLFVDTSLFGKALLPVEAGHALLPLGLALGGAAAAGGALIVAIPSFKTRGDYLAVISLAFLFIVKSLLENLEIVGGPRGLSGQPDLATLPMVFGVVVVGVWMINNYVTSTMGKALNAVRDDESAAEALTVDTRRTKMIAFLMGAFWAGVAGGLFAHALRFVNPATFGVQKLAEMLAMVYFGGLNSVYGSIVGAVSISLLGEMLRPLEVLKWIVIPLMLILVTLFRPTGLVAFKDLNLRTLLAARDGKE